jgi:hypothetical protein
VRLGAHVHGETGVPVGGCGRGEVGEGAEAGVALGVCQTRVGNDVWRMVVLCDICVAWDAVRGMTRERRRNGWHTALETRMSRPPRALMASSTVRVQSASLPMSCASKSAFIKLISKKRAGHAPRTKPFGRLTGARHILDARKIQGLPLE